MIGPESSFELPLLIWEAEWESRKQYSCCQPPNKFISGKPITWFLNKTVIKACLGDTTCAVQVHTCRVKVVTRSFNKWSSSNFLFLTEFVTLPLPFILNSGKVKKSLVQSKPLQALLWRLLDPFPSEEGFVWERNLVMKQNRVKWQKWRWLSVRICTGWFEATLTATGLPGNKSLGSVETNWLFNFNVYHDRI